MAEFQLVAPYQPAGDQPQAIEKLVEGLRRGQTHQTLLGVTGSGKTFTMANVIAQLEQADAGPVAQQDAGRPALRGVQGVLPAQRRPLLRQLLRLLPARGLHPAARHLHREGRLDQRGDRPAAPGRHQRAGQPRGRDRRRQRLVHLRPRLARATTSKMMVRLQVGEIVDRDELLLQARRHPVRPQRRRLRARQVPRPRRRRRGLAGLRGVRPTASSCSATRSSAWPIINPLTGEALETLRGAVHLPGQALRHAGGADRGRRRGDPARSWRSGSQQLQGAGQAARGAAAGGADALRHGDAPGGRPLPGHRELQPAPLAAASRASRRTRCSTSSRDDFLMIVDESHVTVPQVRGMFAGDLSRKSTLVEHGFRLPSALDNRPLRFDEWETEARASAVYVSATPGDYELDDVRRRGRRAGHPADRPGRSRSSASSRRAARCPTCSSEIKKRAAQGRARAGHDADQAAGRGPLALPPGAGPALQVAALGARRHRARDDPPRAARGGVRRPGRRQPAARGARPARGLAGLHPRRRQGGLPAERDLADPDDRPGRPGTSTPRSSSTPTR